MAGTEPAGAGAGPGVRLYRPGGRPERVGLRVRGRRAVLLVWTREAIGRADPFPMDATPVDLAGGLWVALRVE